MSYPETIGTPPLPEKFFFIADIREPRLCIASALTIREVSVVPKSRPPPPRLNRTADS